MNAPARIILLSLGASVLACLASTQPSTAHANHANGQHAATGIGFDQILSQGYLNVYLGGTTLQSQASGAVAAWEAIRLDPTYDWVRITTNPADAQVEVLDAGNTSIWGTQGDNHTLSCAKLSGNPTVYAGTAVTDVNFHGVLFSDYWHGSGPSLPFAHATICLNPTKPNDQGTIAHEIGHALGLDHVSKSPPGADSCNDLGYKSIMAYNYDASTPWYPLWAPVNYDPVTNSGPTLADVIGSWVCNDANAGGVAWIYGIGGLGLPADADLDGYPNITDNCRGVFNPDQTNTDQVAIPPGDAKGDACDPDDDNDFCGDTRELGTNPITGGDRDPSDPWDFYDVPSPALYLDPNGTRDGGIGSTTDVVALLHYGGRETGSTEYDQDANGDGILDGISYDRRPSVTPGKPWRTGPPDGGIGVTGDVTAMLRATGHHCVP